MTYLWLAVMILGFAGYVWFALPLAIFGIWLER
jgi:hypothetical protein